MTGSLVSLLDRFVNTGQVYAPLNVLIVEKVREKGRNSQGFGSKGMAVVSKEDPEMSPDKEEAPLVLWKGNRRVK